MPYRTPKHVEERKEAKRKHILESATRVFSSKGYYNTSMKDILTEADISVGSFYFYFTSKDELFETLYSEMNSLYLNVIQDALEDIFQCPMECVCKAITLALWSLQKNRELAKIMLIEAVGLNPGFEKKRVDNNKRFSGILEEIFMELQNKEIINVPDTKIAAISFMGSVYTLIVDWLQEDGEVNPVDFAYPLAVYNMQALNMQFDTEKVRKLIDEITAQDYEKLIAGVENHVDGDN